MRARTLGTTITAIAFAGGVAFASQSAIGADGETRAVASSATPANSDLPFTATDAAAKGHEVAAQISRHFADIHPPRIVGADSTRQEYALSRGTGGVCLIAVRSGRNAGFEVCTPYRDQDVTTQTLMPGHRVRTVVLQARARSTSGGRATVSERVAPGLWVGESSGELPGG